MKTLLLTLALLLTAVNLEAGQFTINYDDAKAPLIVDAFKKELNWTAEIEDEDGNLIPNPQSIGNGIRAWIAGQVRSVVHRQRKHTTATEAVDALDLQNEDYGLE